MTGSETFAALRAINPGIKVLLCSGHSVDGAAQALIEQGALGFVHKPFSIAEISRQVGEALRG
jgi:DNA-binding NarL/FixJ family response regulator